MKTHVLIVSEYFPKTHYRSGDKTDFVDSIKEETKIHTIRGNYELWKKRIKEVNDGEAILSVRIWIGKPYNSKQQEVFQFNEGSGIGLQKLIFVDRYIREPWVIDSDIYKRFPTTNQLAKNDGLEEFDFKQWFEDYDLSEPFAIIHFTSFRY